jgi:ABC-type polysaccharide/polyol phosphate transport system ATPase subunit
MAEDDYIRRVLEMSETASCINQAMRKVGRAELAHLVFAMGICLEVDAYLFDDYVAQGSEEFRARMTNAVGSLGPTRALVVATSQPSLAAQFCDQAYVIDDGSSVYHADMKDAVDHLEEITKRAQLRAASEAASA